MITAVLEATPFASSLAALASAQDVAAPRSVLEQLADVSMIFIALAILAVMGLLFLTLKELRDSQKKVVAFVDQLREDLGPTLSNVSDIGSNISHVADTLSRRVSAIDETLDVATRQLRHSVDLAHRRVREFDALLGVVQDEVEDVVITATSMLGGVTRGAQAAFDAGSGRVADEHDEESDEAEPDDELELELSLDDDTLSDFEEDGEESDYEDIDAPRPRSRRHRR